MRMYMNVGKARVFVPGRQSLLTNIRLNSLAFNEYFILGSLSVNVNIYTHTYVCMCVCKCIYVNVYI
jgi:hypothetical protein